MKINTESAATGGGVGQSTTADGKIDVTLATPKELGGAGGAGVNPEQLFAVGYEACFLGAMKFAAAKDRIALPAEPKVTADVGIGPRDDRQGFGLDVELKQGGVRSAALR